MVDKDSSLVEIEDMLVPSLDLARSYPVLILHARNQSWSGMLVPSLGLAC